ncbi:MAG: transcription termination factor Rho [Legionellales bacterium]|nr:transcription termination factor Rho [Legionellales bacterium]OUX66901.1 MAG: transcription termination factor Rho [bacterium TMED178]|tara:strand:+ start:10659 stop:11945 length:1287 start_codon:yes stop_codon:yes gene_type:complete
MNAKTIVNINEIKNKPIHVLREMMAEIGIENFRNKKSDMVFNYLKRLNRNKDDIEFQGEGVLDIIQDGGYGFLRSACNSYRSEPDDIYVSPNQIKRFSLRNGDLVLGKVRPPKEGERYFALAQVEQCGGFAPENNKHTVDFESLTPIFPCERIKLPRNNNSREDITNRAVDLLAPIGKGQRALIVAPPKAGKTMLLQTIAHSILAQHPECHLIALGIDERPEEVTEMRRSVDAEVIASTFDEPAARHVQVAEMVLNKAKRLVEQKKDVVILLDSLTRLARAYNTVTPTSGKVLTGGVDANALQRPRRFLSAARNLEEGGSLTIIATVLVETGSKMDEIIYEEFKGTGNSEIHLSRAVAQKHLWPALNVKACGTRREEKITSEDELKKMWVLRKYLQTLEDHSAVEFLIERLRATNSNKDFFDAMRGDK